MTGIAIYVEGGGDHTHQKAELRKGLDVLLKSQKDTACACRLGWKLVPCGDRNAAYNAFNNALQIAPSIINVLLVDSEEGIPAEMVNDDIGNARTRVAHLTQRDRWDLTAADPERIHLMVRCMEAWIVADPDVLARFYGQGFVRNVLPARQNLEDEPKPDIYDKLARATRNTQKGEYGKIKHASKLLERIDPAKVVQRCPRFATFTEWLSQAITGA